MWSPRFRSEEFKKESNEKEKKKKKKTFGALFCIMGGFSGPENLCQNTEERDSETLPIIYTRFVCLLPQKEALLIDESKEVNLDRLHIYI